MYLNGEDIILPTNIYPVFFVLKNNILILGAWATLLTLRLWSLPLGILQYKRKSVDKPHSLVSQMLWYVVKKQGAR